VGADREGLGPPQSQGAGGSDGDAQAQGRRFPPAHPPRSLGTPTQLAGRIFAAGRELLARETDGTKFRLIGIGVSALAGAAEADPADLVDHSGRRSAAAEHAVDRLRAKFGATP